MLDMIAQKVAKFNVELSIRQESIADGMDEFHGRRRIQEYLGCLLLFWNLGIVLGEEQLDRRISGSFCVYVWSVDGEGKMMRKGEGHDVIDDGWMNMNEDAIDACSFAISDGIGTVGHSTISTWFQSVPVYDSFLLSVVRIFTRK
jgi:hypothetical protein